MTGKTPKDSRTLYTGAETMNKVNINVNFYVALLFFFL